MSEKTLVRITCVCLFFAVTASNGLAQTFDLSWHTVDGGGAMNSTGGAFAVSGTVGQPDAQTAPVMSGGAFSIIGGFWPGAAASVCGCPGDMNNDGNRNGGDIQEFVDCVLSVPGDCACANVDGAGGVTIADVPVFVAALLAGSPCP